MSCSGQTLPIFEYSKLYSVISTTYGGDGVTTFALPNLSGKLPIGTGTGPGLSSRYLGQGVGSSSVQLSALQIPEHNHKIDKVFTDSPVQNTPSNLMYLGKMKKNNYYKEAVTTEEVYMSNSAVSNTGQSVAHENRQPSLALQYCICVDGIYPSRN